MTDKQQTLSIAPAAGEGRSTPQRLVVDNDPFLQKLNESPDYTGVENYHPVEVDTALLESLRYEHVFVEDLTSHCRTYPRRYFKNMIPEIPLTQCDKCSNVFLLDEYEFAFLEKKCCPFCRAKDSSADQLMEERGIS